jgi:ATP-binding cassette, subfamily B, bacterial
MIKDIPPKKDLIDSPLPVSETHNWREQLSRIRYAPYLIKLVWEAHPVYATSLVVLRVARSLIPISFLWIGKLIIDAVVGARESGGDHQLIWKLVAVEVAIVVTGVLLDRASDLVERLHGTLFNHHASVRLMAHAATLDLNRLEDPEFHDRLDRARQQIRNQMGFVTDFLSMAQEFLTLLSLSVALIVYGPWLLLLLAVAVLPNFFGETHFAKLQYWLFYNRAAERRRLDYLCYVGASKATAKEVQLYGLSSWLISRYRRLSRRFYDEDKKLIVRRSAVMFMLSLIGTFGYYTAYVVIINRAISGIITLGTLTFLAISFARMRDLIAKQLMGISNILSRALFLKDLFDFYSIKPTVTSPPGAPLAPRPISKGFVFEDVGFRYPGNDAWAVHHVSFELRPGERIAFVGENGAGKTTITKLLSRLYDPTEGRILLDGRDIRDYDLQSLRRLIGVIFQDFVCYDWRFDENIGVGEIEQVKSYLDALDIRRAVNGRDRKNKVEESAAEPTPPPSSIVSAAEKSLASTLLARFPEGYRQMLGRRFEHGVELSGGEWQKVALARAYMRDAQMLILDEPTATLDARAEYEVFKRFSQLVLGRMAIIISHRFSTVRMADRIIVLQNGLVTEEGTHDGLLASGGLYADLFTLQAKGYR